VCWGGRTCGGGQGSPARAGKPPSVHNSHVVASAGLKATPPAAGCCGADCSAPMRLRTSFCEGAATGFNTKNSL
jgi:hypothetical protein